MQLFQQVKKATTASSRFLYTPAMKHLPSNLFNNKLYDIPQFYGNAEEIKDSTNYPELDKSERGL